MKMCKLKWIEEEFFSYGNIDFGNYTGVCWAENVMCTSKCFDLYSDKISSVFTVPQ